MIEGISEDAQSYSLLLQCADIDRMRWHFLGAGALECRDGSEIDRLSVNKIMMEVMGRKGALLAIAASVIALATAQSAVAVAHNQIRRNRCAPTLAIREFRDVSRSPICAVTLYPAHIHDAAKPAPAGARSRSCDRFWCYED